VLADLWEGKKLNAPSDLAVSKSDHVYFTDPAFGEQSDHRELDFYGVYHLPPRGPLKLVAKPAGRPHGIAISPNGRVLYVTNADERNVRAYDLDHNGDASGERVLVAHIDGIPGGLKRERKGRIVHRHGKGIAISAPRASRFTPSHARPAIQLRLRSARRWLYVTARGFLYRIRLDGKVSADNSIVSRDRKGAVHYVPQTSEGLAEFADGTAPSRSRLGKNFRFNPRFPKCCNLISTRPTRSPYDPT
jgi:gluconolactonase